MRWQDRDYKLHDDNMLIFVLYLTSKSNNVCFSSSISNPVVGEGRFSDNEKSPDKENWSDNFNNALIITKTSKIINRCVLNMIIDVGNHLKKVIR